MTDWQDALASLRVLVCTAKADGDVSPSERTILTRAWEQLPKPLSITLAQLLAEEIPLTQLLEGITTPDAQRAVYDAARSLAEQNGIHPQQQRLLDQIQTTFRSSLTASPSRSSDPNSDNSPYESLEAGIQLVAQHNRKVRNVILDYALGAAVIGLIPIPGLLLLQILAVLILIIKMRRHIRALWGFPTGHDILAFVSNWFGSLGCLAIALMAWLTVLVIGAFVPFVDSLARAAAFATLTWAEGQVTNQFYFGSRRMDHLAFLQPLDQPGKRRPHHG